MASSKSGMGETGAKPEGESAAPAPRTGKAKGAIAIDLPASAVSDVTPAAATEPEKPADPTVEETVFAPGAKAAQAEPAPEPVVEPPPVMPLPAPPASTPKLVPGLFGLVAGAIGGFAAYHGASLLGPSAPKPAPVLEQRLAAIEQASKAALPGDLVERLAKAEAALAETSKLKAEIAQVRAEIGAETAERNKAITALANRPAVLGIAGSGAAAPEANAEIERLKSRIGSIESAAKTLPEAIGSLTAKGEAATSRLETLAPQLDQVNIKVETLSPRINAVGDQVSALSKTVAGISARDQLAQASSLVAASTLLGEAFARSEPLAGPLGVVRNLGVASEAVTLLAPFAAAGPPNAATLLAEFKAVVTSLKPAEAKPSADILDRLKTGALSLVEIRKTGEITGTDDAAHLGRAEQALQRGDLATAVTLVGRLTPEKLASFSAWRARAEARIKAADALGKLRADALAALAKASSAPAKP